MLLAGYDLAEVDRLADRVVVIERGRVVVDSAPARLRTEMPHQILTFRAPSGSGSRLHDLFGAVADPTGDQSWQVAVVDSDVAVGALVHSGVPFADLRVRGAELAEALAARSWEPHRDGAVA